MQNHDTPKILVVDDEQDILESLIYALQHEGYTVITCKKGSQVADLVNSEKPNLLILDVMLPGMNGYDVCKLLRSQGHKLPILMLTAKTTEIDAVIGLELGADDFIPKPARLKELMARVRSRLRSFQQNQNYESGSQAKDEEEKIFLGNLEIDMNSHTVMQDGKEVDLTQREFELLRQLAKNPNRVFSREQLLEQVWGWSFIGESRTVDVHVRYLREKLERDPANPQLLKTVRGIGYKLVPINQLNRQTTSAS
ncbi:MAG: response regulator transcription factor [Candidatus Caenarcaniphilales bacterium]|nr:response regulator transcription factor [Candidatus Caenarcaniphilales bacterium]